MSLLSEIKNEHDSVIVVIDGLNWIFACVEIAY